MKNGDCPRGEEIKSLIECSAAGRYLNLQDVSASMDGQDGGVSYDPPFCYYENNMLKFNAGRNSGLCTSTDICICAST